MRRKLFRIQTYQGDRWADVALYKGTFRSAMNYVRQVYEGGASRIKRIKTPAEYEQYMSLPIFGEGHARTEWTN